jgi:hypothetical protein
MLQPAGQIAKHDYVIEGDLLRVVNHGPFTGEEAATFLALYDQVYDAHGYLLLLLDLRDSGPATSEARRILVDWTKKRAPNLAVTAISGSLIARTTVTLMSSAMRMINNAMPLLSFFATEAEARAWLAQHRPGMQQRATAGGPPRK